MNKKELAMIRRMVATVCAMSCLAGPAAAGTGAEVAIDLGLTPDLVAAANVSAAEAAGLLAEFAEATTLRSQLAAADAAICASRAQVETTIEQVRQDPTDESARQAYEAARDDLGSAMAARSQIHAQLWELAVTELGGSRQQALKAAVDAPAELSVEYRFFASEPPKWTMIQSAVIRRERAVRRGISFTGPAADLLSSVESSSTVVAAQQSLAANLTGVATAFESY